MPIAFTTAYAPSAGAKRSTSAPNRRGTRPVRSSGASTGAAAPGWVLDDSVLDAVLIWSGLPAPLVVPRGSGATIFP
nr:hypothetical protein KitaXyl93_32350 [Kitasatospora sp. Xyl93]